MMHSLTTMGQRSLSFSTQCLLSVDFSQLLNPMIFLFSFVFYFHVTTSWPGPQRLWATKQPGSFNWLWAWVVGEGWPATTGKETGKPTLWHRCPAKQNTFKGLICQSHSAQWSHLNFNSANTTTQHPSLNQSQSATSHKFS